MGSRETIIVTVDSSNNISNWAESAVNSPAMMIIRIDLQSAFFSMSLLGIIMLPKISWCDNLNSLQD